MSQGEAGGLFAQGERVPLLGVQVEVNATGVASRVVVSQRYKNMESKPIEAVYSFPLEESSAVCGFEAEIGGRRIVGQVEEKEKAFEQYDEAMAAGHGAFLMDQDRPNIFTASVGNLLPDQEAVIRIRYVTELEQVNDQIRVMIPTTISPRYISPEEAKTMDPAELDHIAPPTVVGGVPYGLKLTVDLDAADEVGEVACPSHPARVVIDGRKVHVELMGEEVQLDRDFVLTVTLAHPHQASAVVGREEDGTRTVMVNLFPDLSGMERGHHEIVFLLDRSGSMQGESIEQARRALLLCLRSLEEGDRFNIVGFGSSFQSLFPKCVPYSQEMLDKATQAVQKMQADLGGTELLEALESILDSPLTEGLSRQVMLLTDGQVSNEQRCIERVSSSADQCRIFTFGIGYGVSEHLVRGIARASRGQVELIQPNERIEPKVLRQFARMTAANLSDVKMDWGNLEVDLVAPCELPPLFGGDRLTVYGRLTGGGPGEVAVVANSPEGPLRFAVQVDPEKATEGDQVAVLLARRAIQDLEEGRAELSKRKGSAQGTRREARVRQAIVDLARRYHLISSETSFVAIEEREKADQKQPAELRRIPVALTKGWHGVERMVAGMPLSSPPPGVVFAAAMAPQASSSMGRMAGMRAPAPKKGKKPGGVFKALAEAVTGGLGRKQASFMDAAQVRAAPPAHQAKAMGYADEVEELAIPAGMGRGEEDDYIRLILGQQADGSFLLSEDLAALSPVSLNALKQAAAELKVPDASLAQRVVATLTALFALEKRFADRKVEWQMIADKATRWLAGKATPPAGFADLTSWIRSVLEP
ncbi:MAG: VWA domain-containing protein [Bradymonadales bacterium]|nr:VWA domain-containing protein [Bradymonadales bacterium]